MIDKLENPKKRRNNLNYIAFIKFWAMILIIRWHIYPQHKMKIDYGARMCEILFISSGFLVGYNYYKREMPDTFTTSFKYVYKHLRTFYPLEVINVLYGVYNYKNKFRRSELEIFILNILIMKTWSRYFKEVSCFSGLSWFLSALMFCYFLTPFLLGGIKNIKNSLILFVIVAFIRIVIEEFIRKGSINILDIHFHRGPVIRCMEFFLGMLTIPSFFKLKEYIDKIRFNCFINQLIFVIFTIIQLLSPILLYIIMVKYNSVLHRCYFVLIFCVFIFVFGYDYGYLSNLISMKYSKMIMSCQMEMYLIHFSLNSIINKIKKYINWKFTSNDEYDFIIKLIIVFIIAFTYKSLLKEKLALTMDLIVNLILFIFK